MNLRQVFIIISVLLVIVLSCKKEEDTQHPVITIYSPAINRQFDVLDTILVEAAITDDIKIISVKVVLVNEEFIPVLDAFYYYPDASSYQINLNYPIDDYSLENGIYYIHIRADDGLNYKNEYQKIQINAIHREFEKILVLTRKNSNYIEVSGIDTSQNINTLFEINGDYAGSEVSSMYQQLYIAGRNQININAYNLDNYELEWKLDVIPYDPIHSFNCLYYDEYLFSSFCYLYIRGYDNYGTQIFNSWIDEFDLPARIFRHNDLILVDKQSKIGGSTYISTYYFISGVEKQKLFSTYKVVEFFSYDTENVIIVANTYEHGTIKLYDPYQNILTEMQSTLDIIISSVKIDQENILIGTENDIYLYNFSQFSLNNILPGKVAYGLRYNEVNKNIYVIGSKKIEIFNYPGMILQNTYTHSDTILNVLLLYNK